MFEDIGATNRAFDDMAEFLGYMTADSYLRAQEKGGIKRRMAKALGVKQ